MLILLVQSTIISDILKHKSVEPTKEGMWWIIYRIWIELKLNG